MNAEGTNSTEIKTIKDFVNDGRIDDAVKIIALYLADSKQDDYIERLENIIETLLALHGGKTVLRFLIENLIIDIPSLLENLSKRDSLLRYTFLLLLKTMCENEYDLILPYSEDLLKSDDPNVREADLQLIIYMAGGETIVANESLIKSIVLKLSDEKDFVIEKAIQALKKIGEKSPTSVTKILTEYAIAKELSETPENEELKNKIDLILKSIVTVEKIEEIFEASGVKIEKDLEKEESEIIDKEIELKKGQLEIKKKKLELGEKAKKLEEKVIIEKEKVLKMREELLEKGIPISVEPINIDTIPKEELQKKLIKEESKILEKEIELKKKDLEIKMKKLEIEEKEKELEEKEIIEKERALKIKEELLEKETELSQVELELRKKVIKEKEQKILEKEAERIKEKLKEIDKHEKDKT